MSRRTERRRARRSRRRMSPVRILVVAAAVAAVGAGAVVVGTAAVAELTARDPRAWFAPYVDVTLQPAHHFESPVDNPADAVVLSFIVAAGDGGCVPTWGTHHTLDGAAAELDLDRRIQRFRERGGTPIVSFGGALNDELAVACTEVDELADAYGEVVDRYDLRVVDMDIEGAALDDVAAATRRGEALARLQRDARDAGERLDVWLTLPVAPSGLPPAAVDVIDATLASGVELAGVNVMTMNYGGSRPAGTTMWEATEEALRTTWWQLRNAYRRAGTPRTDDEVWAMVGATPNIGQNDVPSDRFDLADAERLLEFAARHQIGRISMWSANRDGPCGAQIDADVHQTTCSGLDQEPLAFTHRFAALPSRSGAAAAATPATREDGDPVDDPATSPYPVWRTERIYEAGDKVVWHRDVYEAKWWTQGDLPDAPVAQVWDSPWRYLGPVMPGETPASVGDAPPSDVPRWDEDTVYTRGDRVVHDGVVFTARWWTAGEVPDRDPDAPWQSPWELVD